MKKIFFAINNLGLGGAENMVLAQIHALDKKKFDPFLLTLYRHQPVNLEERISLPKEKYYSLEATGILDVRSWIKIYRIFRKEKPDIVITNLFDTNLVVRFVALLARVPYIYSYEHNIYEDKKRWQIYADKFLARFTKKIFVGSSRIKEFTREQERIPKEKFVLNYNAANMRFENEKRRRKEVAANYDIPHDVLTVVTAGRLVEQKGHIYLIEAAAELAKQTDTKVLFLIFGKGILHDELKATIIENKLENSVRLMGVTNMEDIAALTDIYVMPSLWEGLPLALIEAMNGGSPAIGTRVSGIEEVIEDGKSGILVQPKNSIALAHAIFALIKDREKREKMGEEAKKRSRVFSIENNIRKIEEVVLSTCS